MELEFTLTPVQIFVSVEELGVYIESWLIDHNSETQKALVQLPGHVGPIWIHSSKLFFENGEVLHDGS